MTREYKLGASRVLTVKKNEDVYNIAIFEMASESRSVVFSLSRWSTLTRAQSEIGNAVSELQTNLQLKYAYHIDGGFYVFVTACFLCIDIRSVLLHNNIDNTFLFLNAIYVYLESFLSIRKFYLPKDGVDPKPGGQGIALRLPEWIKLKQSIVRLHEAMPALAEALPCSFSVDNSILIGNLS